MASTQKIAELFVSFASQAALESIPEQNLIVPYFTREFNRCMEHERLNATLLGKRAPANWFQITPACRVNDTRKVDAGNHLTVFNALCAMKYFEASDRPLAKQFVTRFILEFLAKAIGMPASRVHVSLFGGMDDLGVKLKPDKEWALEWLSAGVPEDNVSFVAGFKNFILFVGDGERCGPRAEIACEYSDPSGFRRIEIGTAICDEAVIKEHAPGVLRVDASAQLGVGVAFGLERLGMVDNGLSSIMLLPELAKMTELVMKRSGQDPGAKLALLGDCYILVDQARTFTFLEAFGLEDATVEQTALVHTFVARIRRKIEVLAIGDWRHLLDELEYAIAKSNEHLYSSRLAGGGRLRRAVETLPWPTTWNPDSYEPPRL